MADWSPEKYLAFATERARPAADLIAQIKGPEPQVIVDLGCGPGNSTAQLRQRFPRAVLTGIDASPAMIEKAKASGVDARFEIADVAQWLPGKDVDLVFSNALFQWLPDHMAVLEQIFRHLRNGAVLAVQMPDNLNEPSHASMGAVAAQGPWSGKLASAARKPLAAAHHYYEMLKPMAETVEVWRTTYHHALEGHQGIIDMLSSTGLRPFLDPLSEDERAQFLKEYRSAVAQHYPVMAGGKVLLPFPRLFLLASRADG